MYEDGTQNYDAEIHEDKHKLDTERQQFSLQQWV